jgi:hypothetical protein
MRENSLTTLGILLPPEPEAFPILKSGKKTAPKSEKALPFSFAKATDYPKG